jgi:hypothetical protein
MLVALLTATVAYRFVESRVEDTGSEASAAVAEGYAPKDLPDIYYIILDGYASDRTLKEDYGYSNDEFLGFLERAGFQVVSAAHSNYARTFLSVASALSMEHMSPLFEHMDLQGVERASHPKIQNNQVARFLKARGYKYVLVGSGWGPTTQSDLADVSLGCGEASEVSSYLIDKTLLRVFSLDYLIRERVLCALAKLRTVRQELEGPLFVLAHVVSPHPPYVFHADGSARAPGLIGLYEGGWERDAYVDQLRFISERVEEVLGDLVSSGQPSPIIVLQADHGPGAKDRYREFDGWVRERLTILNAYRVPDEVRRQLYPTITPVNSFRVIFNAYFGADYDLLDDSSYVTRENGLQEVTHLLPQSLLSVPTKDTERAP